MIPSMKKTLLAAMVFFGLFACKKSNEISEVKVDPVPNMQVALSALPIVNHNSPEGDPKYNFLGYGYDVNDKFVSSQSVRAQVINVAEYVDDNPEGVAVSNGTSMSFWGLDASNATELSALLSNKHAATKGTKSFQKTITSAFSEPDALSDKYIYGYYQSYFIRRAMRFRAIEATNHLTEVFKRDLNLLNSEQLVKKFGTHILQRIHIGTNLNVIYQAELDGEANRNNSVKQGFRYAMRKTFGFSTISFDKEDALAINSNKSAKLKYEVIGGDPSKIKVLDFKDKSMVDFNNWQQSVDESNYRFVGFNDETGLIPLYDVIEDANKKALVKAYVESIMSKI